MQERPVRQPHTVASVGSNPPEDLLWCLDLPLTPWSPVSRQLLLAPKQYEHRAPYSRQVAGEDPKDRQSPPAIATTSLDASAPMSFDSSGHDLFLSN
jgi:hypothetical protein